MNNSIVHIARVCHEANRTYCQELGDSSQPSWEDAPEWQKSSALNGVHFHLEHLRKGNDPSPSASHDSWLAQKRKEGWKYGQVKDADKKEHPCFVPYEELPTSQKAKDYLFAAIVKAFYQSGLVQ
jgi:hypothetical protein